MPYTPNGRTRKPRMYDTASNISVRKTSGPRTGRMCRKILFTIHLKKSNAAYWLIGAIAALKPPATGSGSFQIEPWYHIVPNHHPHKPGSEMPHRALRSVLSPVPVGNRDARDEESKIQHCQQPADAARLVFAGASGQKQPGIIERVGAHGASPISCEEQRL